MNISQWKNGDRTFFSLEVDDRLLLSHLAVPAAPPAGDGVPRRHAVHGPPEEGAAGVAASPWRVLWSYLRSQQSAEIACCFYCVFIHLVLTSEVEMLGRCGAAHGALHPQRWLLPPSFGLNMVRELDKGWDMRVRHYDKQTSTSHTHMLN